jgi:hypothetical protein
MVQRLVLTLDAIKYNESVERGNDAVRETL